MVSACTDPSLPGHITAPGCCPPQTMWSRRGCHTGQFAGVRSCLSGAHLHGLCSPTSWCWGSMVPGWSKERELPRQVRRSADLGWRAGGTEESSSFWGPSGHHLGRTRLRKEPAGSRDGQGGKQEIFGHSHATFRHRLLRTPLPKDAALREAGAGERDFVVGISLSFLCHCPNLLHRPQNHILIHRKTQRTDHPYPHPQPTLSQEVTDSPFDLDFLV